MARKPRIHYPGAIYHVILRGNGGSKIFLDDADRYRFYLLVQEGIERFGHRIHAFCLMSNHIHLALQVGTISLSRIMQNLSFRHARWLNWRRGTVGHVFQGRYKAILIEGDSYLLQLSAYLHLNPVRAGIVERPEDYLWSSHRHYLDIENIPWLTTQPVLAQFADSAVRARRLFKSFVMDQEQAGHRPEFHEGGGADSRFLGNDLFIERSLRQAEMQMPVKPSFEKVHQVVKQTFCVTDDELRAITQNRKLSQIRALFAWAVLELTGETLVKLGRLVNRDPSSLSSAVKRLKTGAERDEVISALMEQLRENIELADLQA